MATNKNQERYSMFSLLMPAGVTINSNDVLLFGHNVGSRGNIMAGVAQESQNSSYPSYDNNSGFLTVDFEGAYNLNVTAQTSKSPSAGANINRGDEIFADGGIYDPVSGITYHNSLDVDSSGTFVGIALDPLAAGTTGMIRVILKNAPCA